MQCPTCQTINPPNAKFCLECGNRLLVCPNCGTVNLPIAKFCIECGTALQAAQPRGPWPTIISSTVSPPASQPGQVVLAPAGRVTTTEEAAALEQLLPPEERRVVTVMFADITGSTPLADRLDPEDMRAILTGYFNLMTEQIRKHGGTVEKYIGDAVMAVFGAPVAHEDDPDRAIRATLDMQDALSRFNERRLAQDPETKCLQMRIGINSGEVASPNNAQHVRQDFLITGDAVNVAARLQQIAAPDTILVGERTYLATREVFEFRAMAPLMLKGKTEPVKAYVVQGLRQHTPIITQHPRGIEGRNVPLVGRMLELTLLHTSYDRVQNERHPHLITLLGIPGIGKSRLVREFIAREQEQIKNVSAMGDDAAPLVLMGRCPPYGEGITYWPLIEILRTLLHVQEQDEDFAEHREYGEDDNRDAEQRFREFVCDTLSKAKRTEPTEEIATTILRSIGRGLSDTNNADGQAYREQRERPKRDAQRATYGPHTSLIKQSLTQGSLLRAWRALLESLAEYQPLIIVVDDLQWADEALLDLLEYLTDRITTAPIFFLCCARPDFFERRRDWGGGRRNFTTIELDALSRAESSELIDELLNADDLPDVLRNTILTRAEGNPFFVEEIVRMFIDQGVLICEEDHQHHRKCWHVGQNKESIVSELSTPIELPEDALLSMHYLLPLPRVPDTIQGVLAARVDLLNPVDKLLLQHAAIIGRTFWLSALLELAADVDQYTVLDSLASLTQRDFISDAEQQVRMPVENDQVFTFKHALIRDVVYNNIPRMRRSHEHARLAFWLEEHTVNNREAFAELLAYHYQQALQNWSPGLFVSTDEAGDTIGLTRVELRRRTITYLTMAGDQALCSYYTLRALQAYSEAFELLFDSDTDTLTRIKMHEKLGDAYSQRDSLDEAWQEYRRALRLATSPDISVESSDLLRLYEALAELATRWLGIFNNPPNLDEARQYIDAGLQLLKDRPTSRERVNFLTYQAFWYIRQLENATYAQKAELAEQALTSGHESLRLAEELDNASAISLALDALGFIYTEYHKYNEAHASQHRRQKLENRLTGREEFYDLYCSLGRAHEQVADYSSALMWFGRAWTNAQTRESTTMLLDSMVGRMRSWRQWNRWDEASQVALDILDFVEKYQQDEKRQFWALETLATIAYRRGEPEQGDQYTRQCKRLIDQQVESDGGTPSTQVTARMHAIHLAQEDWVHATADYKEKLRRSEPMPSPEVLATLAELLVMTGEEAEFQESICERAVSQAEASGAQKSLVVALRARGRMYMEQQRWSLAETDLRQALRRCEVLDLPWERGLTLYHLGLLYRRRAITLNENKPGQRNADVSRARYHLELALGFFEALHAEPYIKRVQLALMQETKAPV